MEKNVKYLKTRLFEVLNSDTRLQDLLDQGAIFYQYPNKDPRYPIITYSIGSDVDVPYNEDTNPGMITTTTVNLVIHSNQEDPALCDDIEARIKTILNNNNNYNGTNSMSDNRIICYSAIRTGYTEPRPDPETRVWLLNVSYRITWAMRDSVSEVIEAKANIS